MRSSVGLSERTLCHRKQHHPASIAQGLAIYTTPRLHCLDGMELSGRRQTLIEQISPVLISKLLQKEVENAAGQ